MARYPTEHEKSISETNLPDAEWSRLQAHLPTTPKPTGRPRIHNPREILNDVFYILRSGCAWRPTIPRPRRPSTITSESGESTVPGRG